MSTSVPVLMYHSISDRASPRFRRWTVSPSSFAAQMEYLAEHGFSTLHAREYAECLRGDAPLPEKPVLVTFDDGYADFADVAVPIMKTYGATSTLFVTSAYIGTTSRWLVREGEAERPMLTWAQLEAMDDTIELGAHGYSHRAMDTLPLSEALDDIGRGKDLLEASTGRSVTSLAFPHGYSTPRLRRRLAELGFTSAHGVVDAVSSTDDRRFAISRIIVDCDLPLEGFARRLEGAAVPRHPTADSPKQTLWRYWRRARIALHIDRPHVPA